MFSRNGWIREGEETDEKIKEDTLECKRIAEYCTNMNS